MNAFNIDDGAFTVDIAGCAGLPPGMTITLRFADARLAAAVRTLVNDGLRWQGRDKTMAAMQSSRAIAPPHVPPSERVITWEGKP